MIFRLRRRRMLVQPVEILGAALVLLFALPAGAGATEFNPSISLGTTFTDNVEYIELDLGGTSDATATLDVLLPVKRQLRLGSISFSYNPAITRHRTFDRLDHEDQRASFDLSLAPDRSSSINASLGYADTQQQGDPLASDQEGFLLSSRTQRKSYLGRLAYERKIGARWSFDTSLSASRYHYEAIADEPTTTPQTAFEDKTGSGGTLGVARTFSRRLALGLSYGYEQFDLDRSGTEQVHRLGLTFAQAYTEHFSIEALIGGYRRQQDVPEDVVVPDERRNGLDGRVDLLYDRPVHNVRLGFDVGVSPSSGGALPGSSVNRTAGFSLSQANLLSRWIWVASTRYTQRKPTDSSLPTVRTIGLGGTVERRLGEYLGARVSLTMADQAADRQADSVSGSFYTAGAQLVWYPLRRARVPGTER